MSPTPTPNGNGQVSANGTGDAVLDIKLGKVFYGDFEAVRDSNLRVKKNSILALIGPSGCGKSTVLRSINRMNDLVSGFRFDGQILFRGKDVYAKTIDPVAVRRHIGMVFQQPNPFAMSIFRNVAFGLRLNGYQGDLGAKVEQALRGAALWDEVKDKLRQSGLSLSGGQQQRLCLARATATEPEVLLMDEPCSALDPIATQKIEELMQELKKKYTIVIVTHNLAQAKRVADETAFFYVDTTKGGRTGFLVEHSSSKEMFSNPREKTTRDYVAGTFS
jgi:phosphate transport system ATP-binding protein